MRICHPSEGPLLPPAEKKGDDTFLLAKKVNSPSARLPILLGCLLIAFFVTLLRELPALTDSQIINDDDVRMNMYWMRRFQDPALFHGDLLTDFASSPKYAPRGLAALYYLASYAIDPVRFSSVLPLILIPLTALYLFRLGSLLRDNLAAVMLVSFYLIDVATNATVPTGHARFLYFPFLVPFLYYLVQKKYLIVTAMVGMAPLFYPPIAPLCLGILGLNLWDLWNRRLVLTRPAVLSVLFGTVLAFATLAPAFVLYRDKGIGPMVTKEEALKMPEFHKGGREVYFRGSWPKFLLFDNSGIIRRSDIASITVLISISAVLLITLIRRGWLSLPQEVVYLPIASLAIYLLAHFLLFRLYFPGRYTHNSIPLFLMIFVSTHLHDGVSRWVSALKQWKGFPQRTHAVIAILAVILLSYFILLYRGPGRRSTPLLRNPFPQLTDYLSTLPKDALIAGHPTDMDWVPIFARRKVLVSDELSLPFYVAYYGEIRQRTYDLFDAYYGPSAEQIDAFARKYGVDYLVVNLRRFAVDYLARGDYYYRPFNEFIAALISRNLSGGFAVLRYPPDRIAFLSGAMMVIKLDRGSGNRAHGAPLEITMVNTQRPGFDR
ncbi:MAG: hypothetical protein HY278_11150 [candidate division NC10 bacterium]|nr:hypothetical protein [candidate division NC10 bacterium]